MARKPHARLSGAPAVNPAVAWAVSAASLVVLLMALIMPLWLPRLVRTFVPDRYLVAYAPGWFQDVVFNTGSRPELPTVQAISVDEEQLVLAGLATQAAGTATAFPAVAAALDAGPTPTPLISETAYPTAIPLPTAQAAVLLRGFTNHPQGWNRCGPATLAMQLSFWGRSDDQEEVAALIKPHPEDSNVNPYELADYVEHIGMTPILRLDGNIDTLKRLLSAGYPVIIERGFDELPELDWMGHYMLLVGYSDSEQEFYALDSFWGTNRRHEDPDFPVDAWDYARMDDLWRHFERTYLVVAPAGQSAQAEAIIGEMMDDGVMLESARRTAEREAASLDDTYSWYNVGAALTRLGDYNNAAIAFDAARQRTLPWRMYWYRHEIFEAYYQVGRYEDVLTLALYTSDVTNYPESEESHYYIGLVYEARGQTSAARNAYEKALLYNSSFSLAQERLSALGG